MLKPFQQDAYPHILGRLVLKAVPSGHRKQDDVAVSLWAFLPGLTHLFPLHLQVRLSLSRSTTSTQTSLLPLTAPLALPRIQHL